MPFYRWGNWGSQFKVSHKDESRTWTNVHLTHLIPSLSSTPFCLLNKCAPLIEKWKTLHKNRNKANYIGGSRYKNVLLLWHQERMFCKWVFWSDILIFLLLLFWFVSNHLMKMTDKKDVKKHIQRDYDSSEI